MYPVSEAFQQVVQENARRYCWTGKITTKAGAVYPFGYEDIVKGSGYITTQCCGSSEIELGTVYAAEMLSVYTENDIETYRDVLYFVAQVLGGFFCINREGKLELRNPFTGESLCRSKRNGKGLQGRWKDNYSNIYQCIGENE